MNNIVKYLNIPHSYSGTNCLSLIAKFYETELNISFSEEREIFNNFQIPNLKALREIPIEKVYSLKNWSKIDLTNIEEFAIIMYIRHSKISHFSMYVGDLKILDLRQNSHSVLRHLNDTQRDSIGSCFQHKQLAT